MADFQPRFVDLVRNYTTTTGTADFVLSASVNGYASFASALQAGDSFYYSAISMDKPIEREVGRGTLHADGTISRDAISGTKTTFTGGIKTISLIAAAEWFNTIQAGGGAGAGSGGGTTTVAGRSSLASMANRQSAVVLAEAGREGLFVFDGADLSAQVAADPYQAIYVPPSGSTSGASGAWVRKFDGPVQASWAGFADGAPDNAARLESLLSLADAGRGNIVELPLGTVTMDRRVVVARPCTIRGRGGAKGQSGGAGNTHLVFPAGSTGFRIRHDGGQRSRMEDVKIAQAGLLSSTQTASYNPGSSLTTITLSAPGDFQNGQVVWLEGAGPSLTIPGRTAVIAAGTKVVTIASDDDYGNAIGYLGQMIDIAGAGLPPNTYITAWGAGSVTLSNNATATVSGAAIMVRAPLVAEIQSGGGTTTLAIDSYPDAPQAVSGATIRHAAPAIYSTTQCHARNVEAGGDAQVGLILSGVTTGGAVADGCSFYDCLFAAELAGVVVQGNDAQVNSFFACDFAGPKIGVLEDSLLGNYFYGCHWAFNCGLQVFRNSSNTQLMGGYFESHTGYAAAHGVFFGTMSIANGAGLKGFTPGSSYLEGPTLKLKGPIKTQDNGAGDGAAVISGAATFEGTGTVTIRNNGVAYGGSGSATGYLRLWLNGGLQTYASSYSDLWLNSVTGSIQARINDSAVGTFDGSGLAIAAGKSIRVGGTKVIGAQGASLPGDATDLTSAIALVNAIKARMKATGGHGLVAD